MVNEKNLLENSNGFRGNSAYVHNSLSADERVADVKVRANVDTCEIDIYIVAHESNECRDGCPSQDILKAVETTLTKSPNRIMVDRVSVHGVSRATFDTIRSAAFKSTEDSPKKQNKTFKNCPIPKGWFARWMRPA